MAINAKNIRYWYLMLTGQSVYHVHQNIGAFFDKNELRGYYNDMREKVKKAPEFVDSNEMPSILTKENKKFLFPVGIFQYGFGLLDLYYETQENAYLAKFLKCAEWALQNQLSNGAWDNFSFYYPNNPYGAMAQGQGASLLLRAYRINNDEHYLDASRKAIDFMLKDKDQGGCTSYENGMVVLLEYPHRKAVLNGWIFALWGLYDYCLVTHDSYYQSLLNKTCYSLNKMINLFVKSYWSVYDLEGRLASPFYHNLHIAQLQAMYELIGDKLFHEIAIKWKRQQNNPLCKGYAFLVKSIQKVIE